MSYCKNCFEHIEDHCIGFEEYPIPAGCRCDPSDWAGLDIPKPCSELISYKGRIHGHCTNCDHLAECHTKP